MKAKKLFTEKDWLAEAEASIDERYPNSVSKMRLGNAMIVIQEQAVANEYQQEEFALIGAIVKVATHYGNIVLVARTECLLSLGWNDPKQSKGSAKE